MIDLLAFALGGQEIFFIFLIVLILFGAKRLPELARGLGQSMNEFKKAKDEFDKEITDASKELKVEEPAEKELHKPS